MSFSKINILCWIAIFLPPYINQRLLSNNQKQHLVIYPEWLEWVFFSEVLFSCGEIIPFQSPHQTTILIGNNYNSFIEQCFMLVWEVNSQYQSFIAMQINFHPMKTTILVQNYHRSTNSGFKGGLAYKTTPSFLFLFFVPVEKFFTQFFINHVSFFSNICLL